MTISVLAPSWLFKWVTKVFDISVMDQSTNEYFTRLATNVIEARKQDIEPGVDFLQTLANNMVDESQASMLVDDGGLSWTKEGKKLV